MRAPTAFPARNLYLLFVLVLGGCATSHFGTSTVTRAASDVPEHFLVGLPGSEQTSEPRAGEGCRNPMVDPRDGARLVLVRSTDGQGDYAPPAGRYGVERDELLRLDCGTGRALGIVRR